MTSVTESHRNMARPVKCPKCRSAELELEAYRQTLTVYSQNRDLRVIKKVDAAATPGETYVMARCQACDKSWRVRGVTEITDLTYIQMEPEPQPAGSC